MGIFSEINIEQEYDGDLPENNEQPSISAEESQPPAVEVVPKADQPQPQASGDASSKDTTDGEDEDAKRKAHEEAEAKRKAEFDAKQAAKKAAMQEQLDRLAAMSDDEVMVASMKQVSADTEKLTRRNMKDCVSEHIQTFARKVMHPSKSMIHYFWYINRKAREFVEQEMKDNDIKPENGVYGSDVPDDLCYKWAVDYFNDPDAEEDHKDEEKFVPKPYVGKTSRSRKNAKKEPVPKKAEPKKTVAKSAEPSGQISLGGFMMPEEKAG